LRHILAAVNLAPMSNKHRPREPRTQAPADLADDEIELVTPGPTYNGKPWLGQNLTAYRPPYDDSPRPCDIFAASHGGQPGTRP
jgi:hypothetical protein